MRDAMALQRPQYAGESAYTLLELDRRQVAIREANRIPWTLPTIWSIAGTRIDARSFWRVSDCLADERRATYPWRLTRHCGSNANEKRPETVVSLRAFLIYYASYASYASDSAL